MRKSRKYSKRRLYRKNTRKRNYRKRKYRKSRKMGGSGSTQAAKARARIQQRAEARVAEFEQAEAERAAVRAAEAAPMSRKEELRRLRDAREADGAAARDGNRANDLLDF